MERDNGEDIKNQTPHGCPKKDPRTKKEGEEGPKEGSKPKKDPNPKKGRMRVAAGNDDVSNLTALIWNVHDHAFLATPSKHKEKDFFHPDEQDKEFERKHILAPAMTGSRNRKKQAVADLAQSRLESL